MKRLFICSAATILSVSVISLGKDAPPALTSLQAATQPADDLLIQKAKAELSSLKTALDEFEIDNARYPITAEGLNALVTNPNNLPDWHQYEPKIPLDPWGNAYVYHCPGSGPSDYDLYSCGPDGKDDHGGGDDIK